jgi:multiple antibiotic resistance protein
LAVQLSTDNDMQSLISYTFGTLAALFPIANPIGAVPIFYSLTADNTPRYRLKQARKTALTVCRTAHFSQDAKDKEDISFTPMAVPIIGGPGAIGVVIGLSTQATQWTDYIGCCLGVGILGILIYLSLRLGEPLIEKLGETGLGALNRILGFLILAIAVQLIANGTFDLLKTSAPNLFK